MFLISFEGLFCESSRISQQLLRSRDLVWSKLPPVQHIRQHSLVETDSCYEQSVIGQLGSACIVVAYGRIVILGCGQDKYVAPSIHHLQFMQSTLISKGSDIQIQHNVKLSREARTKSKWEANIERFSLSHTTHQEKSSFCLHFTAPS